MASPSSLNGAAGSGDVVLLGPGLHVGLGCGRSSVQTKLGWDPLNPVGRLDVLYQHNLVAGGSALARSDGRIGKEVLPDLGDC